MHFFAVDAIQAIDVQRIERYSAVKLFLDLQLLVGSFAGIMFSYRMSGVYVFIFRHRFLTKGRFPGTHRRTT